MLYGLARPVTYPGVMTTADREAPNVNYAGVEVVPDETARPISPAGTPVWHPITFKGGVYRSYSNDGRVEEKNLGDLRLPITCVTEASSEKNITTTQVSAAHGTVKEVFGYGDWSVRISGILMDEPKHPNGATTLESMEERILEFDHLADSIQVDSDLLNRRGVDRLVIRSVAFNQIPGKPRLLGFQMQCESDAPLELLIRT